MIGAIVGDVVGSVYEFHNVQEKNFPMFMDSSRFTDDTVLTVALADCIINNKHWLHTIHEYYDRYPNCGWGGMFSRWAFEKNTAPYNSFGNGSAMRVSPVAWLYEKYKVIEMARRSANATHNHVEGLKGAEALSVAILLAKEGWSKDSIEGYLKDLYYHIPSLAEIEVVYTGWVINRNHLLYSCQGSVPQAIRCFLDGKDFEDVIRTAVSIGGDSDTIACMAGAIAEAHFGIPPDIEDKALSYLDNHLLSVVQQFKEYTYSHGIVIKSYI